LDRQLHRNRPASAGKTAVCRSGMGGQYNRGERSRLRAQDRHSGGRGEGLHAGYSCGLPGSHMMQFERFRNSSDLSKDTLSRLPPPQPWLTLLR
jgi:hypothetical protein